MVCVCVCVRMQLCVRERGEMNGSVQDLQSINGWSIFPRLDICLFVVLTLYMTSFADCPLEYNFRTGSFQVIFRAKTVDSSVEKS